MKEKTKSTRSKKSKDSAVDDAKKASEETASILELQRTRVVCGPDVNLYVSIVLS